MTGKIVLFAVTAKRFVKNDPAFSGLQDLNLTEPMNGKGKMQQNN